VNTFVVTLKASVLRSNRQYKVLLKTVFFILVFLAFESLIPILIFAVGIYSPRNLDKVLEVIALLWFLYIVLKYNGALGLALIYASIDRKDFKQTAEESRRKGLKFFFNALRTGVLLIFGQMFMVCACFLFLSNFIFSPFLFVYENLRGKAAEQRSKEIGKGFAWLMLARTIALLFFGYGIFILVSLVLFTKLVLLGILIIFFAGLYIALIQNNFIRQTYEEVISLQDRNISPNPSLKYKVLTIVALITVVLLYIFVKVIPPLLYNLFH
jgi:hypothetical protein